MIIISDEMKYITIFIANIVRTVAFYDLAVVLIVSFVIFNLCFIFQLVLVVGEKVECTRVPSEADLNCTQRSLPYDAHVC